MAALTQGEIIMKSGSTRAMGQNRKHRVLKLLLPLLAITLVFAFGPHIGVSYAQPGDQAAPAPVQTTSDPTDSAAPDPADVPASLPDENTDPVDPAPQADPAQEPGGSVPVRAPEAGFDLTKFLTEDAKLSYGGAELTKNAEGKYIVHPDTPYQLQLGFAEKPGDEWQIPSGTELVYELPTTLQAVPIEKPIDFSILAQGETVTGNTFKVTKDNKIHVKLANHPKLTESQQAKFYVTLDVKFAKDATKIDLNDGIHMDVLISNDPDLSITKSARHDFSAGKVFYTLTVTSIDTNENVVVSDQIQGDDTALHLDADPKAFKIKSTNKKAPKPRELKIENNGFTLTIPKMTHGEKVTIEYSASVDYSKINPDEAGTAAQTENKANVLSDQIPAPKETTNNLEHKLKIGTITKNAGSAEETAPKSGIYQQSWTLNVNKYSKLNVAGNTVKDSIPEEFREMMKYSGDGIKIVVNKGKEDAEGNSIEKTREIPWTDPVLKANDHEWSYELPGTETDPENSSYEITYTTEVDVTKQIVPTSVKNGASSTTPQNPNGPEEVVAPTIGLTPPHVFNVQKKALSANPDEVTWEVAINVVPQGYDSLVLTDTLPAAKSGDTSFQDKLKDTKITVEGLIGDEDYTFERDPENPDKGFTIEFFKNKEHTETGLLENNELDDQQKPIERTLKLTFTTNNDPEWVKAYRDGDDSLYRHVNRVKATANGKDRTSSAAATPDPEGIHKTFNDITYKEIGGVDYPVFNYRLRLEGLDQYKGDSFKITDQFDAQQLKLAVDPKPNLSGVEDLRINQQAGEIIFEMNTAKLPKDSDGKVKSVYYLDYSLIPVSRDALDAINKNPEGLKVSNTATWGPVTTKALDAEYVYGPLTKELTDKPTSSNNYEATFKVTINPGALDIAGGAPTANFKDQMTNLRLQPETLEMTPADFDYHPVYKDGVLTMQVPNKQKVVVTYKAKVIGTDLVNYGNEVEVGQEQSKVEGSVAVRMAGGGSAPNPGITIHKHDSRDLTTQLEGAEFELYQIIDGEPQPVVGKLSDDQEKAEPLRFTTDKNGEVTIKGDQGKLGWSLLVSNQKDQYEYQLKEVKSPEGYQLLEEPLSFTIWENPTDETQQYDGAYLYVANEPKPGTDIPDNPDKHDQSDQSGKSGNRQQKLEKTGAQVSVALGAMLVCLAGGYLILRRREQR
ncbi:SpaA isopeptide-forming pilin-related protein [Varibaculum cambriense]|uniref:SpaA isopeptide-forming pilin-related protein n=1 Tax=Varibaculum cambriense TaxID=184870 RepID=UPI0029101338|nr:SpaA isopeptide-forming pilin-related protein [Varibaculum cambriense]MDU5541758.1 SpaA isopeptide-forming pilin-related protein [Varibaculum cambriense]